MLSCVSTRNGTNVERFTSSTSWGDVEVRVVSSLRPDGNWQCAARYIIYRQSVGLKRLEYMPEYIYAVDYLCDDRFDYINLRKTEDYELLKKEGSRIYDMLLFLMYMTIPIEYHGRSW